MATIEGIEKALNAIDASGGEFSIEDFVLPSRTYATANHMKNVCSGCTRINVTRAG